MIHETSLT